MRLAPTPRPAAVVPPWSGRRAQLMTAWVIERDGGRCRMIRDGHECGDPADSADHIVPIAEGGAVWDPANLRAACLPCNTAAGRALARRRRLARLNLTAGGPAATLPPPSRHW